MFNLNELGLLRLSDFIRTIIYTDKYLNDDFLVKKYPYCTEEYSLKELLKYNNIKDEVINKLIEIKTIIYNIPISINNIIKKIDYNIDYSKSLDNVIEQLIILLDKIKEEKYKIILLRTINKLAEGNNTNIIHLGKIKVDISTYDFKKLKVITEKEFFIDVIGISENAKKFIHSCII